MDAAAAHARDPHTGAEIEREEVVKGYGYERNVQGRAASTVGTVL